MQAGYIISGMGHAGLIAWLLFGGAFAPTPEPFEVTDVAMISGAEFDSLLAGQEPPETATQLTLPTAPKEDTQAPAPAPERPQPALPAPDTAEAAEPDEAPKPPVVDPVEPTELQDDAPDISPPAQEKAVLAPDISDRPVPREAPRIAPEPVAPSEPDTAVDDIVRNAAVPQDNAEVQREEQEATAPEEATTEIVTEAEERPSAAPLRSVRPLSRPNRPSPAPTPEPEAAAPDVVSSDDVDDALAKALGGAEATGTSTAPSGPPLTSGERDVLRLGVQRCWNTGALSTDALRTTIVVSLQMNEDGKPVVPSIRIKEQSGGTAASGKQAFQAARRAIIRCGANGFDLPVEKYAQWREIEITFDPEKMRIK